MPAPSRLKRVRERLAESQEQFARRFGVDQSTIARWEKERGPKRGPAVMAVKMILAMIDPPSPEA